MMDERRGPEKRGGTFQGRQDAGDTTCRRHLGGNTRAAMLKGMVRLGALAGIVGGCVVLANREEKFECSSRCGRCPKNENGNCSLGLR